MLRRLRKVLAGDFGPAPAPLTPLSDRWAEHPKPPAGWSVDLTRKVDNEHAPLASRLLYNRGIRDSAASRAYFSASPDAMRDAGEMPGIERAVERLLAAHRAKERVTVHGDFDADGVTATSIMVLALRRIGVQVDYYLPRRETDGHRVTAAAIREIHKRGTSLVVTVDTGISAYEQVELARRLDMDVIVTDHHIPPARLPAAAAIVNPHLASAAAGAAQYSGAGVALKLALALWQRAGIDEGDLLVPLAAVGTLADRVPLTGDNRAICKAGLRDLREGGPLGSRSLVEYIIWRTRTDHDMDSEFIAFGLAPRLNAPGRVGRADACVELLTATTRRRADELASVLEEANRSRRRETAVALQFVQPQLKRAMDAGYNVIVVEAETRCGAGILGLLASMLSHQTHRPAVVYREREGEVRASMRAVDPGFDVHAALSGVSDRLTQFGGHAAAAGFAADARDMDAIATHLESRAARRSNVGGATRRRYDAAVKLSELGDSLRRFVRAMEPLGTDNEAPRFLIRGARVIGPYLWQPPQGLDAARRQKSGVWAVEGYGHVLGDLSDGSGELMPFVGFHLGRYLPLPARVDAIVSVSYDRYHGFGYAPRARNRVLVHDFGASTSE